MNYFSDNSYSVAIKLRDATAILTYESMSHYITEFLIEPVIRQARRFPRTSDTSEPPLRTLRQPDSHGAASPSPEEASTIATTTTAIETRHGIEGGVYTGMQGDSIVDEPALLSPASEVGGLEAELQAWRNSENFALPRSQVATPSDGYISAAASRRHTLRLEDDETSSNPLFGIPDRFRSTTTSFSNSIHSMAEVDMTTSESTGRSRDDSGLEGHGAAGSFSGRKGDGSLPADDGMGHLRKRILDIQGMEASSVEKARLIHELMTEQYSSLHSNLKNHFHNPLSPTSLLSHGTPSTSGSGLSLDEVASPRLSLSSEGVNPFHLYPDDLTPTYFSRGLDPSTGTAVSDRTNRSSISEDEPKPLGCPHYRRNIKLQCSACDRWYTCRFCHDEVEERSTDCDCPICGEYMFTSPQTVVFMRCGHSIHHRCYYEHMKTSYRCPICSRSIVNMEMQFRHLERAIETQPMPAQFQDTRAWVYCNDCSAKTAVKYHWLGLKCAVCDSYNTAQLQILSGPESEAEPSSPTEPPSPELPAPLTPDVTEIISRGRATRPPGLPHRPTTSAPVVENGRVPSISLYERFARSESPRLPGQIGIVQGLLSESDDAESTSTDNDDDTDLDFWGGESPRLREGAEPQSRKAGDSAQDSEDDEDDEDEDMTDVTDGEEDSDDEEDHMEIFGHL
ncbi:hypothetical protein MMC12_006273 [Toensbergia leucococca]|nr:hypothetical protein [Toensbergia leucococca]